RFSRDWSSDVCSSDLIVPHGRIIGEVHAHHVVHMIDVLRDELREDVRLVAAASRDRLLPGLAHRESFLSLAWRSFEITNQPEDRSEERRVGKEGQSRW